MSAARRQGGFSLVELMVALAVGMLIVLALVTVLINVNRNNTELARNNSVIEGGRFSVQLLEADVSHAGFWAGFVPQFDNLSYTDAPTDRPQAIPDPCLAYAAWDLNYRSQLVGIPLQVYEVSATGAAPTMGTCPALANAKALTHVLIVRHAAPCPASAAAEDEECQLNAGDVYFQPDRCSNSGGGAPGYLLVAAADASLSNLDMKNRDCASVAGRHRFISHIYWIRRNSLASGSDGLPTLVRSTFKLDGGALKHASSEALVEGVEGFRVELGIDSVSRAGDVLTEASFDQPVSWDSPSAQAVPTNRGDGSVDRWIQCTAASPCSAFDLMNVVAVRLNVLVRAPTPTAGYVDRKTYTMGNGSAAVVLGAFNDSFKRHLYSQTIRLANVSARREVAR